jgi:hypothetical protein
MGSLVSSLDLYNHSTVPSLGEPVGPVRKLYLSYFRGPLYLYDDCTRLISLHVRSPDAPYLPVDYTCLSVIQVPFFQLFVPAYPLYTSLSSSFSYLPIYYTFPFLPAFRICLFIIHFPFFQLSYLPIYYIFPFLPAFHGLIYEDVRLVPLKQLSLNLLRSTSGLPLYRATFFSHFLYTEAL